MGFREERNLEAWKCKTDGFCDLYTPQRKRCKKCRYLRCCAIGMQSQLVLMDEADRKKHTHPKKKQSSKEQSKSLMNMNHCPWSSPTTQCGSLRIFLPLNFYVKSILSKLWFLQFLRPWILISVNLSIEQWQKTIIKIQSL